MLRESSPFSFCCCLCSKYCWKPSYSHQLMMMPCPCIVCSMGGCFMFHNTLSFYNCSTLPLWLGISVVLTKLVLRIVRTGCLCTSAFGTPVIFSVSLVSGPLSDHFLFCGLSWSCFTFLSSLKLFESFNRSCIHVFMY